jgi:nucleotide-binding universal stress UspA family protein
METTAKKDIILAATDFTHVGDFAIDNAAALARVLNAKVMILHVINKETHRKLRKEGREPAWVDERLQEDATRVQAASPVEAGWISKEGSIFTTIAEVAREHQAKYVFIGTHGKKGIQRLLGSFALKVIKRSPSPVFSVKKPAEGNTFRNIVYPLDLELGSKQKVKWANHLGKLAGTSFHLLVYNPSEKSLKAKVRADLNQVLKIMDQHGVRHTETFAAEGESFSRQIIPFARQKQADAIIISTDPSKISWALFGSSDEKIIYNEEKIPVLCINSKDLNLIIGGL